MIARISGIEGESIVDGIGLRAAVFFQGCPHNCLGCHNPNTHDANGGEARDMDELLSEILENPLIDGVTLTGGDPFMQAKAAAYLAAAARGVGLNVWTYTGYTFEELTAADNVLWNTLIAETDVLVDGRFIKAERTLDMPFVGSKNQRKIDVAKTLASGEITIIA
ncbi:MAG: anaerobic ribonucleoside-triphosphate reductase activating protein [Clostridia bacterium]